MFRWWFTVCAAVVVCTGCTTHLEQPRISGAVMTPNQLNPGDAALVTVQVHDPYGIVEKVEGQVLEDTTVDFNFNDLGQEGDEVARDGIWTMKVEAPFNAPPGNFTFEISAYDSQGNLLVVLDENKEAVPMSTEVQLKIVFPEMTPETE